MTTTHPQRGDKAGLADEWEKVLPILCADECEGRCKICPLELAQRTIRALRAQPPQPTACQHEPFEGKCVHCGVPFVNGKPAAQPTGDVGKLTETERLAYKVATTIAVELREAGSSGDDMIADRIEGLLTIIDRLAALCAARELSVKTRPVSIGSTG